MNRLITRALLLAVAVVAVAGCSRARTIPKRELKQIFKESFLANAYNDTQPLWQADDSLDLYRPILERHGYRVEDLEHTVNRFARQKSATLSNVVEQAIEELDRESKALDQRVAFIDTMVARAEREYGREALWRERIEVRRVADTARLRLLLPVEEGTYEVSYSYLVDSADQNRGLRATAQLVDSAGVRRYLPEFSGANYFTPLKRQKVTGQRIAATAADRELELVMGNYPARETKTPSLVIDSLKIMYYPPREKAIEMYSSRWLDIGMFNVATPDSSALRTDTQWFAPAGYRNP
jgi:hypothetical protein